jgi:hypothetical protein
MRGADFDIPDPATRVPPDLYRCVKDWLLSTDPDGQEMMNWSATLGKLPKCPEDMAGEIIWIILCAGRSAQAARTIEKRVWEAIQAGRPVVEAFGYKAKAAAIDRAWQERHKDFKALRAIAEPEALVEWCGSLPFVGDDTKFQLAKNFGADVCKPDIWLCRLAGFPDRPRRNVKIRFEACMALCRPLAACSGDRIATVDSMLWLACNKGILAVTPDAGQITFNQTISRMQPIMRAG